MRSIDDVSGPVVILLLEKENAIAAWRELCGPSDLDKAREVAPNRYFRAKDPLNHISYSLRAMFGKDTKRNAVYGSDSAISVIQDISMLFDAEKAVQTPAPAAVPKEQQPASNLAQGTEETRSSAEKIKDSFKNLSSNIASAAKSSMQSLKDALPQARKSADSLNKKVSTEAEQQNAATEAEEAKEPIADLPPSTEGNTTIAEASKAASQGSLKKSASDIKASTEKMAVAAATATAGTAESQEKLTKAGGAGSVKGSSASLKKAPSVKGKSGSKGSLLGSRNSLLKK